MWGHPWGRGCPGAGSSESLAPTDDHGLSRDRGGSEPRREGLASWPPLTPQGTGSGQVSRLVLLAPSHPRSVLLSTPPLAGHRAGIYHTGLNVTTPCKATGFHS